MSETSLQATSTISSKKLAHILNDNMADLMVPAVVYIVILMLIGTIGNIMVCFYYGLKTKFTANSLFVVVLAVYDLIVCLICMPTEIADIELYYTFENDAACKILRFITNCASLGSILTLLAIALDRHKRIRKPLSKQMSPRDARISSAVCLAIAALLTLPSALLFDSTEVDIPNKTGRNLTGFDCTTTQEGAYRPYVWAYYATQIAMFIIFTIVIVVLYAMIGLAVRKHRQTIVMFIKPCSSASPAPPIPRVNADETSVRECTVEQDYSKSAKASDRSVIDQETLKITMVMVAVSTLFILSFLPYISLIIWRVMKGQHEAQFLSDAGLLGFEIGARSFLLNSAFNPWIYGIFNSKFRQYFFNLHCCRKARNI